MHKRILHGVKKPFYSKTELFVVKYILIQTGITYNLHGYEDAHIRTFNILSVQNDTLPQTAARLLRLDFVELRVDSAI